MEYAIPRRSPGFLDYWRIVCRFKWMIVGLVISSALVTGIVSKLSPKMYAAKATIFPAREESVGGIGLSGGGDKQKGGSLDFGGLGKSGPSQMDTLQAILTSRGMAEAVISQLNLIEYYGARSMTEAIGILQGSTEVKPGRFKMIEVTVESTDPQMAADIANAYVSNLDRLNKELNSTSARRFRIFIENRLIEKSKKLAEAEDALKRFQNETRMRVDITPSSDGKGGGGGGGTGSHTDTAVVAELHERIMELEVQLAALKEYALPSHPMINQLAAQIREYRAQLDRLESERVGGGGKLSRVPLSKKYYPAFEEMTALQFKLLGLMRHVRVEDSVYTMLVSTLEAAKIAEVRDLPTIQVVDSAIPPTSKIRPKPLHNMLVAGVLSLLLGLFLAFSINYVEVLRAQEVASASIVDGTVAAATVEANGNGNKFETYPVSPRESERLHGPV